VRLTIADFPVLTLNRMDFFIFPPNWREKYKLLNHESQIKELSQLRDGHSREGKKQVQYLGGIKGIGGVKCKRYLGGLEGLKRGEGLKGGFALLLSQSQCLEN